MPEGLAVSDLSKSFKGIQALLDVFFHVRDGEILSIIGPNAGQSNSQVMVKRSAGLLLS